MYRDHFWLTDEQFEKLNPHLPVDTCSKFRVDDRRVMSGIIHVIKSSGRWVDAPAAAGPRKTLYISGPHLKNSSSSSPDSQGFGPRLRVVDTRLRETGERPSSLMNLCISSRFLFEIASQGEGCT
jgi:transposase